MMPVREMPEAQRRQYQENLGLVIVARRSDPPPPEKKKRNMDQQRSTSHGNPSKAQQALERMTEPPTFKQVVLHELQRAAVYMPLLISAGAGLLWVNKRLLMKVV